MFFQKAGISSYEKQKEMVANLATKGLTGYEVPGVLEACVSILAHYFDTKTRLFRDQPATITRCQESVEKHQLIIGDFGPSCFIINLNTYNSKLIGVAVAKKL